MMIERIRSKVTLVLQVSEEGTKAAAATAVAFKLRSRPIALPIVPEFHADRPYLYAIVKSRTLTFIGQFV